MVHSLTACLYFSVDNIEAHVEVAASEVERGRTQLGAAVRYKVNHIIIIIQLVNFLPEM